MNRIFKSAPLVLIAIVLSVGIAGSSAYAADSCKRGTPGQMCLQDEKAMPTNLNCVKSNIVDVWEATCVAENAQKTVSCSQPLDLDEQFGENATQANGLVCVWRQSKASLCNKLARKYNTQTNSCGECKYDSYIDPGNFDQACISPCAEGEIIVPVGANPKAGDKYACLDLAGVFERVELNTYMIKLILKALGVSPEMIDRFIEDYFINGEGDFNQMIEDIRKHIEKYISDVTNTYASWYLCEVSADCPVAGMECSNNLCVDPNGGIGASCLVDDILSSSNCASGLVCNTKLEMCVDPANPFNDLVECENDQYCMDKINANHSCVLGFCRNQGNQIGADCDTAVDTLLLNREYCAAGLSCIDGKCGYASKIPPLALHSYTSDEAFALDWNNPDLPYPIQLLLSKGGYLFCDDTGDCGVNQICTHGICNNPSGIAGESCDISSDCKIGLQCGKDGFCYDPFNPDGSLKECKTDDYCVIIKPEYTCIGGFCRNGSNGVGADCDVNADCGDGLECKDNKCALGDTDLGFGGGGGNPLKFLGLTSSGGSPVLYDADFVDATPGYQGVDGACKGLYPTANNAHVCSTAEITALYSKSDFAILTQAGKGLVSAGPPGYTANANDCVGWTVQDELYGGQVSYARWWDFDNDRGWLTDCRNDTFGFACCAGEISAPVSDADGLSDSLWQKDEGELDIYYPFGNVGVGGKPTDGKFDVKGGPVNVETSGSDALTFSGEGSEPFAIKDKNSRGIKFMTGNNENMFIDSSGRVGIGTDNPGALTHIFDDDANRIGMRVEKISVGNDALQVMHSGTDGQVGYFSAENTSNTKTPLTVNTNGTGKLLELQKNSQSKFVVDNAGRIGVVDTIPDAWLDIEALTGGLVAIGNAATSASGDLSVAIGASSAATAANAMALGNSANASGVSSVALGSSANASQLNAVAIGYSASAGGQNAVAIGNGASANNANSMALGYGMKVNADNAVGISLGAEGGTLDAANTLGIYGGKVFINNAGEDALIADGNATVTGDLKISGLECDGKAVVADSDGNLSCGEATGGTFVKYLGLSEKSYIKTTFNGTGGYTAWPPGYTGVNAACRLTYQGDDTVHVCTIEDILALYNNKSFDIDEMSGVGLVNAGPPGYTAYANDCMGWTKQGADKIDGKPLYARWWDFDNHYGLMINCASGDMKFSCCAGGIQVESSQ